MKNLLTTQQLREKYDPDSILKAIEQSYNQNLEKLRSSLNHPDSPLQKYNRDIQISLLDANQKRSDELIDEVASTLKDTIYFMTLSKKERTSVTQRMRSYYSELVKNQFLRINYIMEDPEIGSPKHGSDPTPKHKGMHQVFEILKMVKKDLEFEYEYRQSLSRSGYLTGLQISMGKFFIILKSLGMNQKDQITLVQRLFDDFEVDWDEGDRENIKLSLQLPALENYKLMQQNIQKITSSLFSKSLNDNLVSNLVEQAVILKKRLRRF